ncbi:MAG: cupin domain-containing protein [Trueperaceae bacterium]|nr:MAG: cupin domain-containing protein [Trueperaceae bacterium]
MTLPTLPTLATIDPHHLTLTGSIRSERRLSDLEGVFEDEAARCAAVERDDPVVYRVFAVERGADESGALSFGLGVLQPGRVGDEYFMTKGHLHTRREAAEVYVGMAGRGIMLLEDHRDGRCRAVAFGPNDVVYVPGHTAHRTVNVGTEPLAYLGIYPSDAGHDYAAIASGNFRQRVVRTDDAPRVVERAARVVPGGAS